VVVVWAALHYGAGFFVPRGSHRPVLLFGYEGAALACVLTAAITLAGAGLSRLLGGQRPAALTVTALALVLWTFPFGTMDDWLKDWHPAPTAPTAGPYLVLIAEYAYWAVLLLAVAVAGGHFASHQGAERGEREPHGAVQSRPAAPAGGASASPLWDGSALRAALSSSAIAAAVLWLLSGPRVGATYRLQVYFAVAVAFYVSTLAACRFAATRDPVWFWPAPLIVGLAGVAWAVLRPAPPPPYAHLNIIPAVPLVRPLPVEMLSIGLLAIQAALRSAALAAARHQGGK
jgi:hypothetical protein